MTVEIMRTDKSACDLRCAAAACRDAKAARRMLAIALILDGTDRKTAAANCGMDRQTLRDWVHRYNDAGIEGLSNWRSPGRQLLLSVAQKAELASLCVRGRIPKRTAWCAGGALTSSARLRSTLALSCMSGPLANNW